jgi:hypothetical protein
LEGEQMKTSILIGTTRKGESVVIGKPGSYAVLRAAFIAMKKGVIGTGKNQTELARIDLYGLSKCDADKSRKFKA